MAQLLRFLEARSSMECSNSSFREAHRMPPQSATRATAGIGGLFITGKWVANANGIGLLSFIVPIVTDTTPPVVTSVTPADGTSNVSVSTSVTAQFNEAMAPGTIGSSNHSYPYPNGLFSLVPSTDLAHTDMLRDFGAGKDQQFALTQVPNGTYDVYVWTVEDGSPQTATLSVEGNVVGTYTSGVAGRWDRLGPFRVAVSDGDIQVRVQSANGVAFVSGLEVWQGGGTILPPPPPTETFYRAINIGGPATTIDGNNWDANTGATTNFATNGTALTFPGFVFAPPQPTADQAEMLRSCRYAANLQLAIGGVASDTYDVYVWTFEDNQSLNATLSVEGTVVLPSYNTGSAGHWDRLGPFPVTVTDGNLQINFLCNTPNDLGFLSGVEVWQSSAPLAPPVGTFYRAINVGGPGLVIDGNNWEGEGAPNYTVNVGSNPFTLKDALNNPVPASVSYDPVSRVATLRPSTGLNGGTTYTARIKGGTTGVSDLAGNTLPSDVQWTFSTAGPPVAPSGLAVSAVFHTRIDLTWVDASSNETGFKIERKTGAGGSYAEIATVGPNVTAYSNTGLTPGTSYFYRVRATNGNGDSAYSAEANGMTTNTAPVANAQSVAVNEDGTLVIVLTGSDVDGDTLTFSVVTGPMHGGLSGTVPNLTYTPTANYNGADSFTFKANDGTVDSNTATVSITVTPVNDPPAADAQSVTTLEDTAKVIVLTGSDPDGDTLIYSVVTQPTHGALSGTAPNLTYTPAANYNGSDSFTFKVNDGHADSNIATVSITVTAFNDPPIVDPESVTTNEDTPKAITLTASDVDGDPLTFSVVTGPTHGALSGTAPNLTYTPAADYNGADSFTFQSERRDG